MPRQIAVLESGGQVKQVTMGWDEDRRCTVLQRSKESSEDYRYFPEPDLPPLELSPAWVESIRATLPELPDAKIGRFIADYGLSRQDAEALTAERPVVEWFEQAVAAYGGSAKEVANWVTGQLFALINLQEGDITSLGIRPDDFAELLKLVDAGTINRNTGKKVLEEMVATGQSPAAIVKAQGLAQVSDEAGLTQVVDALLAANPGEVAKYREGKTSLLGWFMGQVMKETRGTANPDVVRKLLVERLEGKV